MLKKTITIGTNTLLEVAKRMCLEGKLSAEQYSKMVERNEKLSNETRKDIIEITE